MSQLIGICLCFSHNNLKRRQFEMLSANTNTDYLLLRNFGCLHLGMIGFKIFRGFLLCVSHIQMDKTCLNSKWYGWVLTRACVLFIISFKQSCQVHIIENQSIPLSQFLWLKVTVSSQIQTHASKSSYSLDVFSLVTNRPNPPQQWVSALAPLLLCFFGQWLIYLNG